MEKIGAYCFYNILIQRRVAQYFLVAKKKLDPNMKMRTPT